MPSTTASPVVDATCVAVIVVSPAVKIATTVALGPVDPENVLGVGAPVWPGRDVEVKFIVLLLAAMVNPDTIRLSQNSLRAERIKEIRCLLRSTRGHIIFFLCNYVLKMRYT